MAKKKTVSDVNVRAAVLKSPKEVISAITSNIQGIKFTKVLSTYVMESKDLEIELIRDGKSFMDGDLIWLGNRKDNKEGTVFCFQANKRDMKTIMPTNDNCQSIILDVNKGIIKLSVVSRLRCAVCGKSIEIFDEESQCPICEAKAHSEHLKEWIKMKGSCPVCKKGLALDRQGIPIIAEE
ncbi:MAG: hypothetical protein GF364_01765 [Candidatus Lokiarchaeota archaeon]|nr:hypothetical protein [Candidatus Lokiarchaeota archaeon]